MPPLFSDAGLWLQPVLGLTLILGLVFLSAAFACSETVLFSLTPLQLQQAAASGNPFRRLAARLMRQPERTLLVILTGNTAVNVLIYATSFLVFNDLSVWIGEWATLLSAVVGVGLVAIAGEVLPKVAGVSMTERLVPLAAAAVHISGYLLRPVGVLIEHLLVRPLERVLWGVRDAGPPGGRTLSTAELKALLELSRGRGAINPTEDQLLRQVVDLHTLRVRDVMVPRVELVAFDVGASPEELRQLMRRVRRKKVPVYERTPDNIVGLVYAKVLFLAPPDKPLRELAQPVHFVPEIITCEQLLLHFRHTRTQLAIAVDEFGGVAGLVTLEDVIEQIVGDIQGPDEPPAEPEIVQISDTEYEISGALSVHYWARTFGVAALSERFVTVGGLVTAELGRPARVGDRVRFMNLELEVTSVQRWRVERLRLRLLPAEVAGNAGQSR
jgi:CBS domain containing-hemolysin-like protein